MSHASTTPSRWRGVYNSFGPLAGLVAACLLFGVLRPETFLSWENFEIILLQTAVIGVAALGMTLIIVAGGIDLSFGSIVALGTVLLVDLLNRGLPPLVAMLASIVLCGTCGMFSGLLITRLRIMPFIVTLGMMGALRGAAKQLADNQTIYPDGESWLNSLMLLGGPGGLSVGVWGMLGLAVIVALTMRYTRFGRHVFAVGSNELTARLCGVPVERVKLLVYAVGAAFAGLAAVLQYSKISCGDPTTAVGLELNIIAAVVIGGASLSGGQGTITGTLVGALIMSVVDNGCTKLGLENSVQEIVTGGIIIVAALLDRLRQRSAAD